MERMEYQNRFPHTAKTFDDAGRRWHAFRRYLMAKVREFEAAGNRHKFDSQE